MDKLMHREIKAHSDPIFELNIVLIKRNPKLSTVQHI